MELHDLVHAALAGDLITARQWVADARRERIAWERVERPRDLTDRELSVAAALAELLAGRAAQRAPTWTGAVGGSQEPVVFDPGLEQMPRSFSRAKESGPEPLRKRNLIALPDFLDVA